MASRSENQTPPETGSAPESNTAPAAAPAPLFAQQLGTACVQVTVGWGEKSQTFTIHKALLCGKSPYFDRMFNSGFEESKSQTATLPTDDPEAFELFVSWIYLNTIELPRNMDKESPISRFIQLYAFAVKAQVPEVADRTMDALAKLLLERGWFPSPADMELGYDQDLTPEKCGLRKFLSRFYVFITLYCFEDPVVSGWKKDHMGPVHRNNVDLWNDTFELMRGQSGVVQRDPRTAHPCDYHFHSKEHGICPYAPPPTIQSPPTTPSSNKRKKSN